jgi:hypothetical protein
MSMNTHRHVTGAPASQGGQYRAHQRAEADTDMLGGPTRDLEAAQNPSTEQKKLTALSYSKSENVRIAVAGNPSTPVRDLLRMRSRGAAVAVAAGENSALIAHESKASVPSPVGRLAGAQKTLAVASDPGTDPTALDELSYSRDPAIRGAVASNPATPAAALRRLAGPISFHRQKALANPSFPAADALHIAESIAAGDHLALLRNPTLPSSTVDAIVARGTVAHIQAAGHPNVSSNALGLMAGTDNPAVLAVVAQNSRASRATRELAATNRVRRIEALALAADIEAGRERASAELAQEAARVERNRRARERRATDARELVTA